MNDEAERDAAERRITAELQVEAFISLIQARYGIESKDIPRILDDMRWVREHRGNIGRITWTIALGIIALAVTGLASSLWEGFKHMVKS